MADWVFQDDRLGLQPIADTSTVQNHPLGTITRAKHETLGAGEFIYLQGIGSTVVGSVVSYTINWLTALAAVGTGIPRSIAIAMSANVASQYGWYQISGLATAKKAVGTSLAAAAPVGINTIGLVSATASLTEVYGAVVAVVASAKSDVSTVRLMINRPTMQGSHS